MGAALACLLVGGIASACRARNAPAGRRIAIDMDCQLDPPTPAVGPATLTVVLRRPDGSPIRGASLRVEGHMAHPGMSPVLAGGVERPPGVYTARLRFTMPGDWVVLVTATLADGQRTSRQLDLLAVRAGR